MPDVESLLSSVNVNQEALLAYAKDAANFSTNYKLPNLEFALNHRSLPDVDMFDFTCMNRSENAALVRDCNGTKLLIGLVGDCLVEVSVFIPLLSVRTQFAAADSRNGWATSKQEFPRCTQCTEGICCEKQ